jgi:hypothetical protein
MHMPGQIVISTRISDIDRDVRLVDHRRSRSSPDFFQNYITWTVKPLDQSDSIHCQATHCTIVPHFHRTQNDEGGTEFKRKPSSLYTKPSLS